MARKKPEESTEPAPKADPVITSVGIVKRGALYYVATLKTQGDKVLETEWNNHGDVLGIAQETLRTVAGRLFWLRIHREA